jgi:hypothetical protein
MKSATLTSTQHFLSPLRIASVTETYTSEINGVAITVGRVVNRMRLRIQVRKSFELQILANIMNQRVS